MISVYVEMTIKVAGVMRNARGYLQLDPLPVDQMDPDNVSHFNIYC